MTANKRPQVYKVDQTLYFKQRFEAALECLHTGAMLLQASLPFRENVVVGLSLLDHQVTPARATHVLSLCSG